MICCVWASRESTCSSFSWSGVTGRSRDPFIAFFGGDGYGVVVLLDCAHLEYPIALEPALHHPADLWFERHHRRAAIEKQYPLDQHFGVFISPMDGFSRKSESRWYPQFSHISACREILVDGRKLFAERRVQNNSTAAFSIWRKPSVCRAARNISVVL